MINREYAVEQNAVDSVVRRPKECVYDLSNP
jgi:hypothetical protein